MYFAEEEIKRLHQALDSESSYNQVGYNYEGENGHKASGEDSQSPKQSEDSQEEDQAFVPPPELEIPEGMVLVRFFTGSPLRFYWYNDYITIT
jgi:hypothetical protein